MRLLFILFVTLASAFPVYAKDAAPKPKPEPTSNASKDQFLDLDGVKGESQDDVHHDTNNVHPTRSKSGSGTSTQTMSGGSNSPSRNKGNH